MRQHEKDRASLVSQKEELLQTKSLHKTVFLVKGMSGRYSSLCQRLTEAREMKTFMFHGKDR
jgi:hypothetical protein